MTRRASIAGAGLALSCALTAGCVTGYLPPEEDVPLSRSLLEAAAKRGSGVVTITMANGLRKIVGELVLKPDEYCYLLLAQRSDTSFSDHWINYDEYAGDDDHRCVVYSGVRKVVDGDARK